MRTKRKRACRKPPARKSAALAENVEAVKQGEKAVNQSEKAVNQNERIVNQSEEAFLSFINQNRKGDSVSADSNDLEVVDLDSDEAKSNSSLPSSSSDSDESFSAEESISDDSSSVDRRSRKSTKRHGNRKQEASKLPNKGRKDDVNSSRVLSSFGKKHDEYKMSEQDPRYNTKELKAALEVIKKIMKMDEAQPFSVPVDPVALGKSDYFNVIDTPMDFGTICSNLENSTKYMNTKDVFNDVQYIWENCCKCNQKGEYIVYLMKRVKKKFIKYWIAAGLSIEQSGKSNASICFIPSVGTSFEPSTTDYATRHRGHEPFYPVGSADGASQMQQGQLGFNLHHLYFPSSCYSQPHQLLQPPPSTTWPQFSQLSPVSYHQHHQSQHPPPSTNQPQFSQLQSHTGNIFIISAIFFLDGTKKDASIAPAVLMSNSEQLSHKQPYLLQQQQSISKLNAVALPFNFGPPGQSQQPHLSYKLPYGLQQYQQSINRLQSSQLQGAVDGDHTRSHGYVPYYPVDPMVVPRQSHPQQSRLSNGESSESQERQLKASHCQPQSSQLQHNVDIGTVYTLFLLSVYEPSAYPCVYINCMDDFLLILGGISGFPPFFAEHSHTSLTDSALRGIRCALRYSASPKTNKSNQENQGPLGCTKSQPEQSLQRPEERQFTKKRKGRGPTRCLFLNDLADGERIFVRINKFGQPVGPNSSKLSSFLGTVARNGHRAPLNFIDWRGMPDSYKDDMWEYTKFDIDPTGKSWVMQSIATKWRDWKADLKATYYDSLNTNEERLKVSDPRVVPDQWPSLISYWNSEDSKKRCARNRANRQKHTCGHSSGTKSYARICEEERNKRPDGKKPTRAELYILTHTRKNGQPVDDTAAKLISKIREQEAKKQNASQCSDESNDTLCQVMGEEQGKHVGPYGMGPNRTGIFGPRPGRVVLARMASKAKRSANEEVRKMAVKMEAMEEKYALMEKNIARMTSNMEKFLEKIGGSSNILASEQVTFSYTST
ncbi:Bromodomain-containing 4 [Gossypium australe]|uniref:Bromodomain-containing 4 n=1 Tax=Gossypium australe TaxID=47621 RepID=A0A5B6V827_9ROSI|nr:Bromodomain-containing 4 [Gossypium australe]